ncbi:unnamed protein product [Prorocentrum cordatum]|uniref:Uncharacterized protein n=1 Tax=Prorocentrum cordatum TaxID=2364126 RepID=A0ABN9Y7I0_9DINO|nr:unnamed protein product [Polarella glacialis]
MSQLKIREDLSVKADTLGDRLVRLEGEHSSLRIPEKYASEVVRLKEETAQSPTEKKGEETPEAEGEDGGLDSEMCQEQEQEQEQEAPPCKLEPKFSYSDLPNQRQWDATNLQQFVRNGKDTFQLAIWKPQKGEDALRLPADLRMTTNYATRGVPPDGSKTKKRRLPNASVLLYVRNGANNAWVLMTLAEAESTRRLLDLDPSSRAHAGLISSLGHWLTLWPEGAADPGFVGKSVSHDLPPVDRTSSEQEAAAWAPLALTRFFNAESNFSSRQIISILKCLEGTSFEQRSKWLTAVADGRWREIPDITKEISVKQVLYRRPKEGPAEMQQTHEVMIRLRKAVAKYYPHEKDSNGVLKAIVQQFDKRKPKNGKLDRVELEKFVKEMDDFSGLRAE